jgi:hypothetical protein
VNRLQNAEYPYATWALSVRDWWEQGVTYCLIRTHILRGVCVCDSPVEAVNHGLEASGCVLKVYGHPFICGVNTSCIAEVVRIFAVVVASKRVIESVFFDDDLDCGVVGPFEAEETGEEVLTGLRCLSQRMGWVRGS